MNANMIKSNFIHFVARTNEYIEILKRNREKADLFWVFAFCSFCAMSFFSIAKAIVEPQKIVAYAIALIICSTFAYTLHLLFDLKGFFKKDPEVK
jgi:ammonia channel protein AmtB